MSATAPAFAQTARLERAPTTAFARLGAYVRLTKPRVIELLLVTAVPPMILAAGGMPSWRLVAAVVLGGALAAGGANALNCWIERDRDRLMRRTQNRPLPSRELLPARALAFGVILNVIAFAVLTVEANLLAALLTLGATLFYVFVYTIWLKPRSTQNIVIGGAAGAVPALVGWAAVRNEVDLAAWILFAIVFFWTPAHFWALAIKYRDDYAAAGIPMMPVTRGEQATTRQILGYAVITALTSLLLALVADTGTLYVVAASILGVTLVAAALRLAVATSKERALRFFVMSNLYLLSVFAAVALDTLV